MTDQALVEKAFTMLDKSYVPYSHFPRWGPPWKGGRGDLHRLQRGERCLWLHPVRRAHRPGEGHQRGLPQLHPPAVVGNSADYCWPCGACRQMLYEFSPDLEILVARGDHQFVKYTLRQLLPGGFGPDSLA